MRQANRPLPRWLGGEMPGWPGINHWPGCFPLLSGPEGPMPKK
ncbi:MAG: hypothetical protein OZSIB_1492 [Candidatus Ozemobacter sibiricus]|uniref:Uncharacterized protein n=1 Tax=Candidatus Ozemobacter sibiricus TaxID=2268124 RepID=A0A367ZK28_9BACT|nr:MAG: hypothetical protein OZSIB_1492 [Candidatus Ozemobacter sibiricus]